MLKNPTRRISREWHMYVDLLTFVSWFISMSSSPTLLRGCELFITLLVSEPVYTTTPNADPDATTQFAQSVFSTSRLSSLPYPSCCNAYNFKFRMNACIKGKQNKDYQASGWNTKLFL
jgi:hypothetical protein